jgi:IS5 family transposase
MREQALAMQSGFEKFGRKSRRELFPEEMDKIVPWTGLVELIQPYYPKGENGRPPLGLERMLRLYFLQQPVRSCAGRCAV